MSMLVEKLFDLTTWEARACVSGETKGWAAEWAELLSAVSCRGMRMVRPLPSWVRTLQQMQEDTARYMLDTTKATLTKVRLRRCPSRRQTGVDWAAGVNGNV